MYLPPAAFYLCLVLHGVHHVAVRAFRRDRFRNYRAAMKETFDPALLSRRFHYELAASESQRLLTLELGKPMRR
jgi:hypothetical protein